MSGYDEGYLEGRAEAQSEIKALKAEVERLENDEEIAGKEIDSLTKSYWDCRQESEFLKAEIAKKDEEIKSFNGHITKERQDNWKLKGQLTLANQRLEEADRVLLLDIAGLLNIPTGIILDAFTFHLVGEINGLIESYREKGGRDE